MRFSGIVPVYKPRGMSSFDVIRRVKKFLPRGDKRVKIGHGGTLDVLAEGVLPVLLGEATKAFDYLLKQDKVYEAEVQLGSATSTDDTEGDIIARSEKSVTLSEIEAVLPRFRGEIEQIPPKFSALKIDGVRAYDLARTNREVEQKPRRVTVYELHVLSYDEASRILACRVKCSSGTYIRSIARDIGEALGCYGHILTLKRTMSVGISAEASVALDALTPENLQEHIVDLNRSLALPVLEWNGSAEAVRNGQVLKPELFSVWPSADGLFKLLSGDSLLAIVEKKGSRLVYQRVFVEE